MDLIASAKFMGAAGAGGIELPAIGAAFEGGYYAGLISHTADGNATHALIVAPKATGSGGRMYPGGQIQLKTDSIDYGAYSSYDGAANTALIPTSVSPIINFIVNLSIGGYTDWYLPAQHELNIAYDNLKPTTQGNSVGYGSNPYAVPATSNRTSTVPGQTSVSAFQMPNGSEAFYAGSDRFGESHWTSNITSSNQARFINFGDGERSALSATYTLRYLAYRAFRKVAL